jgi:hypothetical protein
MMISKAKRGRDNRPAWVLSSQVRWDDLGPTTGWILGVPGLIGAGGESDGSN